MVYGSLPHTNYDCWLLQCPTWDAHSDATAVDDLDHSRVTYGSVLLSVRSYTHL
eukprot:CAMPEP_0174972132 /NCGR_PEP_ID=MMETSP0004_2-20121128/10449_1 /TAXON_ID=420556 /ORGANISM="Ochromonas sp., Strain CCMP1393" /LENGTH=53 /DNA_ID=CAMNT_0016222301 /DNA_START=488 /DNA_END=649 /DNA_ORIENTATION=-